jgi:hypothetical protein
MAASEPSILIFPAFIENFAQQLLYLSAHLLVGVLVGFYQG